MRDKNSAELKRLHVVVTGRVQGVGFRYFTKENAEMYHVTGWVKNCANGSVEAEAQAPEEILNKFCEEVKKGPIIGTVSDFKTRELVPVPDDSPFRIRY